MTQGQTIADARELLAFIRDNRAWFAGGKMIEPYESEAVAKLARWLDQREALRENRGWRHEDDM